MTPQSDGLSLSIAMCTYNGEAFLPGQLASIAAQTTAPAELVVCDDQSKDRTLEMVSDYAQEVAFPVRIFRNESNLGSTKNFEQAIRRCTGDIIVLADQDDVWDELKLARLLDAFEQDDGVGMVFSDAHIVYDALEPVGYLLWETVRFTRRERALIESDRAYRVLLKHNVVTGATMAFRTGLRDKLLPIPRVWIHDGWIAIMVSAIAAIKALPEPLIRYRQHSASQIGAKKLTLVERARYRVSAQPTGLLATGSDRAEHLSRVAESYALVAQALQELPVEELRPGVLQAINGKVRHLRVRAQLAALARHKRLLAVLSETLRGDYFRYSFGVWSVAKDLVAK